MRLVANKLFKVACLCAFALSLTSCLPQDEVTEDPLARFSKENESDVNLVFNEYIKALGTVQLDSFDVGDSVTYTRSFLFQGSQYLPYQTVIYKIVDIATKDSEPGFIYYTFTRKIISLRDNTPDYTVEMAPVKIATDVQALIKELKDKATPTVTLHNLSISKEVLNAPTSSKNKGVCGHLPNDCTYQVTKIAYDMVDWQYKYSVHFEFRISPDLPFLLFDPNKEIESHMGLPMLGIASVCKRYWQSYDQNKVYTSDCLGLKEFEFGPEEVL